MARARIATALILLLISVAESPSVRGDHVNPNDIITVLPPDAIPAITNPSFDDDIGWLPGSAWAIGVSIGGVARAYPLAILNWHEIVDDVVGGIPIAVTYCPLCGTGIVFERTVGSEVLVFKVSGKLYKNDLVMYDTSTESLWSQLVGEGILGAYHGTRLSLVTSATMAWDEWRALHPDTKLLDRPQNRNGEFLRNYDVNPYAGYDRSDEVHFPQGNIDPYRVLEPKEPVLGVFLGKEARAYPQSILSKERVVNDVLGGTPLLATYASGVMKAWERGNRTFRVANETAVSDEEGRVYDAISGQGAVDSLAEIPAVAAYWFAWYDFYPSTTIYGYLDLRPRAPLTPSPFPIALLALGLVAFAGAATLLYVRRRVRRRGR